MQIEFVIKTIIYLIVPSDFSKDIASLIQTMKPISILIKFVVMKERKREKTKLLKSQQFQKAQK
jgi:hypothetical protein